MTDQRILLSVVICTCDRHDVLPEAIDSVLRQRERRLELIVVDNSTDQQAARVFGGRYAGSAVRYVYETTQGLSQARNRGVAMARAPRVAFLDDDAVAAPGWAGALLQAFAACGENTACVGGKVMLRWHAPRPPWLADRLLSYLSMIDWPAVAARPLKHGEWLAGCNIAFDRTALLQAGGFSTGLGRRGDGSILLSNEELKVCAVLRSMGRRLVYTPKAVVEHRIGADRLTQNWFLRRAAWQAVSDFIVAPEQAPRRAGWRRLQSRLRHRLAGFASSPSVDIKSAAELEARTGEIYYMTIEFMRRRARSGSAPTVEAAAQFLKRLTP